MNFEELERISVLAFHIYFPIFFENLTKLDLSVELLNTCGFGKISTAQVALPPLYGGE